MIRINLLADRHAKDRLIIQQQLVLASIIILATVVLCGFWWNWKRGNIATMNEKIESANKELNKQKDIREKVKEMEARERRAKEVLEAIDYLKLEKRGPVPYFDNLNILLPPEIWLTRLSDNNGSMQIKGYSFSNTAVAKLMKSMEESEHFVNIELKEITKAKLGKESLNMFTVSAMTTLGQKIAERKAKEEAKKAAKKKKKKK